jgi:hypothetical protein
MNEFELFSLRKKSGVVRKSCHNDGEVCFDCPDIGVICLVDDINRVVIVPSYEISPFPYKYAIIEYDDFTHGDEISHERLL